MSRQVLTLTPLLTHLSSCDSSSLPAHLRGMLDTPMYTCWSRLIYGDFMSAGINDMYCSKTIQWIVFWLVGLDMSLHQMFAHGVTLTSFAFDYSSCDHAPQLLLFDIDHHKFAILCGVHALEFALLQSNNFPEPKFTLKDWLKRRDYTMTRMDFETFLNALKSPAKYIAVLHNFFKVRYPHFKAENARVCQLQVNIPSPTNNNQTTRVHVM